nr:uncharacterized protein LOC127329212 [Lolium perenne]
MAPKKLRIRGEAQVPDERREPTSQDAKALIIPNEKDNWTYDKGVRQPSSMIGALIRQYWPGFYTPVPGGEKKLAETWADYEAAPCPGFGTASDAVYTKSENKEDAFEALVARWVGEDADFNAKSARNKANRGTGGTHSAGSRRHRALREAQGGGTRGASHRGGRVAEDEG